jgi:hypothetical protein
MKTSLLAPLSAAIALALALGGAAIAAADEPMQHPHMQHDPAHMGMAPAEGPAADTRQLVRFPEPLRTHELQNMRDHLLTLGRIQDALGQGKFDEASELAETRLGMTSLPLHGAHEVAPYMPQGMQEAGTAMHHSASRLAMTIKDASVTGDLKPVLAALANLNQACVACHASYKLQ